jgi:hypothetical protein
MEVNMKNCRVIYDDKFPADYKEYLVRHEQIFLKTLPTISLRWKIVQDEMTRPFCRLMDYSETCGFLQMPFSDLKILLAKDYEFIKNVITNLERPCRPLTFKFSQNGQLNMDKIEFRVTFDELYKVLCAVPFDILEDIYGVKDDRYIETFDGCRTGFNDVAEKKIRKVLTKSYSNPSKINSIVFVDKDFEE